MAEVTKYQLITNNNNIITDIKTHFSVFRTKKNNLLFYGVVLLFVLVTIFLAFSPSSSSPINESYRSHFSSVYSYFFPNSTQSFQVPFSNNSQNLNKTQVHLHKVGNFEHNNTSISQNNATFHVPISEKLDKVGNFEENNSTFAQISANNTVNVTVSSQLPVNNSIVHKNNPNSELSPKSTSNGNQSSTITPQISQISSNSTKKEVKSSDLVTKLSKNQGNEVENLVGCDLYDGSWVRDETYPLYKPGSCKLVDEQFNCLINGRPDNDYQKLKWKPNDCALPRLNANHMLNLLRGKRLVFVGDSLNRNMWESLVCILKSSVKNKKKVYEAFGKHRFRTEASYSFVFKDYNCTVEFFVSPFLVQQWEVTDKNGTTKETLQLDRMVSDADQYKNADYMVFNTGHWWTHDKIKKGEGYYQEGNHVYEQLDVVEAFRKAITTWARWVDANADPQRTHVLFRGYSATHFRGGRWNSGGKCDGETEPIKNETYLTNYPWKMEVFESVIKEMKTPVSYLNVTRLTDYRKDGHPSVFRKHLSDDEKKSPLKYQDCSHWCLPGVPDSWNELLYAELLRKQFKDKQGISP